MSKYDSTEDSKKHIEKVRNFIEVMRNDLWIKRDNHDKTKLVPPEKNVFDEYTPKLATSTYGSEEYKGFLKEMQVALDHHYSNNRHHPEHFTNGIKDMTLVDLCELIADWKAATLRHNDGNILKSIEINQERFGYSDELKQIFINTAKMFTKYMVCFGCCDGSRGLYLGDTVEEIHASIDADREIGESYKSILKYGYHWEFKEEVYFDRHYVIDNGFDVTWKVNY